MSKHFNGNLNTAVLWPSKVLQMMCEQISHSKRFYFFFTKGNGQYWVSNLLREKMQSSERESDNGHEIEIRIRNVNDESLYYAARPP